MPLLEDVARVASNLGIPAEAQKGGALPVLKAACEMLGYQPKEGCMLAALALHNPFLRPRAKMHVTFLKITVF